MSGEGFMAAIARLTVNGPRTAPPLALQQLTSMSRYHSAWAPNRSLTNAKFEGYKLSFDDEDEDDDEQYASSGRKGKGRIQLDASANLPGRTLRGGAETRFGYKQARSRARWNHLSPGVGEQACWIDGDGTLWMIDLAKSGCSPERILTLPEPIETIASSSAAHASPAEYPATRHIQDDIWACCDGLGRLYVVNVGSKTIQATYEHTDAAMQSPKYGALHAVDVQNGAVQAVISGSTSASSKSDFWVDIVHFDINTRSSGEALPLSLQIALKGNDLPAYTTFINGQCCLGSTVTYKQADSVEASEASSVNDSHPAKYEPTEDEFVGVPQAELDGEASSSLAQQSLPPPFSWNQTEDSVTIVFGLPTAVNARDIKIVFRPKSVSVMVSYEGESPKHVHIPRLDTVKLWDDIDAGLSTWTWEKAGGDKGQFGLLALHLEKKNENTRWLHAFSVEDNPALPSTYKDVDETLDPSELARITEAMEKFTGDLASSTEQGPTHFDQRSTLLGQELDMEVDSPDIADGKGIVFTWIDLTSTSAQILPSKSSTEMVELLSLPVPSPHHMTNSILTKHDVDGLLFDPPSSAAEEWTHRSTFPALAFVLASKRDVVHVYHYSDKLAIGLEMGSPAGSDRTKSSTSYASIQASKMNAYLYFPPPPGSKAKHAKQKVVSMGDADAGAVLGAAVFEGSRHVKIAVLCEKQIIVLQSTL